jgi:flagellar secretion chaperone FliS
MSIQHSYREAAVRGASPVGLVVRLYEQIVEDLRHAAIALKQTDIEGRTNRIKHAIVVIGHLQSALDFVNGGKVAKDLDHFYNVMRQNLVQAQFYPSNRRFIQEITNWLAVREAWITVERAEKPALPPPTAATVPVMAAHVTATSRAIAYGAAQLPDPARARMDFKG